MGPGRRVCVCGGGTAEFLSLHVVSGPLFEVSACGLACAAASRHSDCLHGRTLTQRMCLRRHKHNLFHLSLPYLVLEVISCHFCCSHKFVQVQGGGIIDITSWRQEFQLVTVEDWRWTLGSFRNYSLPWCLVKQIDPCLITLQARRLICAHEIKTDFLVSASFLTMTQQSRVIINMKKASNSLTQTDKKKLKKENVSYRRKVQTSKTKAWKN